MGEKSLTYAEIGLTRTTQSPAGYRTVHHRIPVGSGRETFNRLAEGILSWELQRGAGLSVRASSGRAVVGCVVVPGFGIGRLRLPAPCRVVWVEELVDSDDDGGTGADETGSDRTGRGGDGVDQAAHDGEWPDHYGARRAGFGYGTLPGHPERGEEAFTAELAADGTVYFGVFAYSRPANWFYRLGVPVARFCQWLITRRYLVAAKKLAAPG